MRHRSLAFLLVLTIALPACGGSGGSSEAPPAGPAGSTAGPAGPSLDNTAFQGTYYIVGAQATVPRSLFSVFGEATADGAGSLAVTIATNQDGMIATGVQATYAYTVAADGALVWSLQGSDIARGHLGADGALAAVTLSGGADAGFFALVRRDGDTYSAGSLSGPYALGNFGLILGLTQPAHRTFADLKHAGFNGADEFKGPFSGNTEGTITTSNLIPLFGTPYSVLSTGVFTLDPSGFAYEGQLALGGAMGLFAGDAAPSGAAVDDSPAVGALVRYGTGRSAGTFSGAYHMVGIEYDLSGAAYFSQWASANSDGAGGLTLAGQRYDGTNTSTANSTGNYSVSDSGGLVLDRSATDEDLTGAVTGDGRFAFVTGGLVSGSNPGFFVFIRK